MRTQLMFRGCSYSLIGVHVHSMGVQGVFNTHSLVFMCTHKCSGVVQYSLKGIHVHSQVFRVCSVLTQMRSFSWSHNGELRSIVTQWHSCTLNGCSHSLNGVLAHQWVFRGCSHSLIGVHMHSQVFRRCSIRVQPVNVPEGPMNMFSHLQST
jgi:hypothetical protein